jgi:hypothetical protein
MDMNDLWQWIEREESHEDLVTPGPIVAFAVTRNPRDVPGRGAGAGVARATATKKPRHLALTGTLTSSAEGSPSPA